MLINLVSCLRGEKTNPKSFFLNLFLLFSFLLWRNFSFGAAAAVDVVSSFILGLTENFFFPSFESSFRSNLDGNRRTRACVHLDWLSTSLASSNRIR